MVVGRGPPGTSPPEAALSAQQAQQGCERLPGCWGVCPFGLRGHSVSGRVLGVGIPGALGPPARGLLAREREQRAGGEWAGV